MHSFPRDTDPGKEPVCGVAAVALKELLSPLFQFWEAAAERSEADVEFVHQLRVSTRRLDAALNVFQDFLPRRRLARFRRRLALIRKSAGPARDCDVFLARVLHAEQAELLEPIALLLRTRRAHAQTTLRAIRIGLDQGERPEQQASELLARLRARSRTARRRRGSFPRWAADRLSQLAEQFLRRARPDMTDIDDLHRFRVRVKQFRYSLELLAPAFDPRGVEPVANQLRKLARRLGELTDHATAATTLRRWLKQNPPPETRAVLKTWRRTELTDLAAKQAAFADWWTGKRRKKLKKRLAKLDF